MSLDVSVRNALTSAVLGRVSYQGPANVYVAFIVGAASALVGGTEVSTVATGYARTLVTNSQANFPAAAAGQTTNALTITAPTSSAAWHAGGQQINCVRLFDASTGGNLVGGAMLTPAATVDAAGVTLSFAAGSLSLTIS